MTGLQAINRKGTSASRWRSNDAYIPVVGDNHPVEPKKRKPRKAGYGKLGTMYEGFFKDEETGQIVPGQWAWQLRRQNIIRGFQRRGIQAHDFDKEAVYSNERTSPRVEIPAVVVETMRVENNGRSDGKQISSQDLCIFWRLFAHAKLNGIASENHSISMAALKAFLDVADGKRIVRSLEKLSSTRMSLHLNQPGFYGRKAMFMIEEVEIDGDVVRFRLADALLAAVLQSRGYAFVDINALPRFQLKYTIPLYIRLCHKAGQHWAKRQGLNLSRAQFRDLVGMPAATKARALETVLATVRDDLLAISGKRRRFAIEFDLPTEEGFDARFTIAAGDVLKRLKEVRRERVSGKASAELNKLYAQRALRIDDKYWPARKRLQQAATLVGASIYGVADKWRTDVWGVLNNAADVVGISAPAFQAIINENGIDDAFEYWLDRKDFGVMVASNLKRPAAIADVGIATERIRKPAAKAAISLIDIDDLSRNHGVVVGDDPLPPAPETFAEVDDDEIDF